MERVSDDVTRKIGPLDFKKWKKYPFENVGQWELRIILRPQKWFQPIVVVDEYLINLIHYDFGNVTDAWPYLEQICMYQCTNL